MSGGQVLRLTTIHLGLQGLDVLDGHLNDFCLLNAALALKTNIQLVQVLDMPDGLTLIIA